MKIKSHDIAMESKHQYHEKINIKQSARRTLLERGDPRLAQEKPEQDMMAKLSEAGLARQAAERSRIPPAKSMNKFANNLSPNIQLLKAVIEKLTGKEITLADTGTLEIEVSLPQGAGIAGQSSGIELVATESEISYSESESLSLSAFGSITTADGATFGFSLDFSMERSFSFTSSTQEFSLRAANLKDPLVLNFSGTSAQLRENATVNFDLDNDGTLDEFSFVGPGSGFLAIDMHNDGSVKEGSQLFGTTSGNGFADLAKYDQDTNGWIDESDDIFARLMIWSMNEEGELTTRSLKEANVGAIYLGNIDSQYSLKGNNNATLGQIRNTGVFLTEDGRAKTIQHVDIAV